MTFAPSTGSRNKCYACDRKIHSILNWSYPCDCCSHFFCGKHHKYWKGICLECLQKLEQVILTEENELIGYENKFKTLGLVTGRKSIDINDAEFYLKKEVLKKGGHAVIKCEIIKTKGQTVIVDSKDGLKGAKAQTVSTEEFTIRGECIRFTN